MIDLERFGPAGKDAVPALKELLKGSSAKLRIAAASALWQIARDPAVVPPLSDCLKDSDEFIRGDAASALAEIGPAARTAVPAMAELLKDEWEPTRYDAARALGKIGPDAKTAVPVLIASVKRDRKYQFREDVIASLREIGPTAIPSLMEALKDKEDDFVRGTAAEALGWIGPEADAAVPALGAILKEAEGRLRVTVALALWRISKDERAVPALVVALDHKDDVVRWEAAEALAKVGPPARDAVPALCKALKEGDEFLREDAATALGRIGPDAKAATDDLAKTLKDKETRVRVAAAVALWHISRRQAAIPALVKILQSPMEWERDRAVNALAEIGPEAKAALPALDAALNDEDEFVVSRAAETLGSIGPDARPAAPKLIQALKDNRMYVSESAAEALKKIDPEAAVKAGVK